MENGRVCLQRCKIEGKNTEGCIVMVVGIGRRPGNEEEQSTGHNHLGFDQVRGT